jgi:UDP-N-acetylglucosamine 2-epimerase (non-hydrolysing)
MTILVAFGTRPEAIKLAPVIAELRRRPGMNVRVVITAQHRQLLDQVLQAFSIVPDADLAVMHPRQTLSELSSRVLSAMDEAIAVASPDLMMVQGDTTSAFMSALAAFYRGVPIAHVEAGLRTPSVMSPFPEEMNRRLTSTLTYLHFAPTERARQALLNEGVSPDAVFVTGNPVVDALHEIRRTAAYRAVWLPIALDADERLILVTLHRRESWGAMTEMCGALQTIVERRSDVRLVIPVHPNPVVRDAIHAALGGVPRVSLIESLDYLTFVALMEASWIVLTDSGGVQEEAPVLGRPVLVLRETTERPEALEHGVSQLVGTRPDAIVTATLALLDDPARRARMARVVSPFGDGRAASRIADIVEQRRGEIHAFARAAVNPQQQTTADTR